MNIQRGRDHGLLDYNSAREQMGLERVESFADITSDVDVQERLQSVYESVDDIDVWVGALAEDHVRGASVGELTQAILVEQFSALRDGDRFWYQNTLSGEQLREIEQMRLSDVIERNTDLTSVQDNAFVVPGEGNDRPDNPLPPQPPRDASPVESTTDRNDGQPLPPPPPRDRMSPADDLQEEDEPSRPPMPPRPPVQDGPQDPINQQPLPPPPRQADDGVPGDRLQIGGLEDPAVDEVFGDLGRSGQIR